MIGVTHILCPIDFSDTSTRVLAYAAALASIYGSRLEVLHVAPEASPALLTQVQHAVDSSDASAVRAAAAVQAGCVPDVVVERARTIPADLIVMGAQGASGLELALYGSNTHRVVRAAACPVMAVRS